MLAATLFAVWFLLNGYLRTVWGADPANERPKWERASKADRIDSAGVERKDVRTIMLWPGQEYRYNNAHIHNPHCGPDIRNKLLWEAENPTSVRVRQMAAYSLNWEMQPVNLAAGEAYCGNVTYIFSSTRKQMLRVSPIRYDLARGQRPPQSSISRNLCATTTNRQGCLEPMLTLSQRQSVASAKTTRSIIFGILLAVFATATRIGYFRIYTALVPSQSAKRAAGNLKAGRKVNVRDLAKPLGSDFERRQRTEDLTDLVAQARAKGNELEKKYEAKKAKKGASEKAIIDELEEATRRVSEIQNKLNKGKDK